ncbi:MAG: NHL repeat-containing protein [Candidatus Brocadiia bacterium]
MSRRRLTLIVIGVLILIVAVIIAFLPVPLPPSRPVVAVQSKPATAPIAAVPAPVNTAEKYELIGTLDLLASVDPGFGKLKGIALSAHDELYAAGDGGVLVWRRGRGRVRESEWQTSGPATCIALDDDGNVYIGQQTSVEVLDRGGKRLRSWGKEGRGPGELDWVTGIAVFQSNVLVADAGNRCIHRFDTTGDFIADIGKRDPEAKLDGLVCPSPYCGLAVDKAGVIYVTNPGMTRVERYSLDGKLLGFWGEGGALPQQFSGCCNPTAVALFGDGRVATAEKITPRVKVYDAKGEMRAFIGPEHFTKEAAGLGLAIDSEGRLFVLDPGDANVRVFQQQK